MFHTGTYTGYHRGIKPKPPPACEASALDYSLSLPNMLSGHSAGSQRSGLSCYVSHWPGTPCCHQQYEWRPRTLSAPSASRRPAASLSSARSPPMSPAAVASDCSRAGRDVQTGRSQVQGTQPPVTPRSIAGHQVTFSPIHEIIMPDGDSTFCNTTITYTTGHPERTNRTLLRSGSLTERTN